MNIYFNLKPPKEEISYGGGLFFVKYISEMLVKNNINVHYELIPNLDLIFIIDPRKGQYKQYGYQDLVNYQQSNPNTKLVYIVNECDIKRKISIDIEPTIINCIKSCNHIVYISHWLKDYYQKKYNFNIPYTIINNACDTKIFKPLQKNNLNKIKLVTHHWSADYNKGFKIYNKLDKMLPQYPNIKLTFIGNYHKDYKPKNINLKKPLSGINLAREIQKHNIYLTASLFEPGGMHQLEGMASGLPVLYTNNSGGIEETCSKCGIKFNNIDDLLRKINLIIENYSELQKNIDYKFLSYERCFNKYIELINELVCI